MRNELIRRLARRICPEHRDHGLAPLAGVVEALRRTKDALEKVLASRPVPDADEVIAGAEAVLAKLEKLT